VGVGGYTAGAGRRSDDGMGVLLDIFVCSFRVGHCVGGKIWFFVFSSITHRVQRYPSRSSGSVV
jgi:hypothetical protein